MTFPGSVWAELGEAVARLVAVPQDAATVVSVPAAQAAPRRGASNSRELVLEALRTALDSLGVRTTDDDHASAARQGSTDAVELAVDPTPGGAPEWLVAALARLWLAGSQIDWSALHQGAGRRVELPTYPFQRKRYWIDAGPASSPEARTVATGCDAEPPVRSYVPIWRPFPRPLADLDARLRAAGPWLLLGGESGMSPVERRLLMAGAEVIASADRDVAADSGGDPEAFLRDLIVAPRTCVIQDSGIDDATTFVDTLREVLPAAMPGLVFLTSQAVGVSGADLAHPEQAPIGALATRVGGRHIDTDAGADLDQTLAAMVGGFEGPTAVRGADVWVRGQEVVDLDASGPHRSGSLRDQVVGITGSVGAAGLEAAVARLEAAGARALVLADLDDVRGDGVLSDEAVWCLIALCPDSADGAVLAARAHSARQRGRGRWLTLSWDASIGDDDPKSALSTALGFLEGAVSASDHVAQVVIAKGSPQRGLVSHSTDAAPAAESAAGGRGARPALAVPYVEPGPGLERSIAEAWIHALNVEPVGADDNFFELGGRSMTAVQLAASIGSEQSVVLPATAVVEHPTVRTLASRIRELSADG